MLSLILAVALAIALPAPSPAASSTAVPTQPKTIEVLVSSPYCNSLADHFNGALVPMLGNDRTLDAVGVQLDDLDTMFKAPNYVQTFLHVRDALGRQETKVNRSLALIQREINALREGARLSSDPAAQTGIHDAAQDLQAAYDKQRQLGVDLQNMYISLMQYNPNRLHPTMGGFDPQDMAAPSDARSVKSYLRFNGQRDIIAINEGKATDIALGAADKNCGPKQ